MHSVLFVWFTTITIELLPTKADVIQPTIANSSGEWYISSESDPNSFQFNTINCGSSYCYIKCSEIDSCLNVTVNGAQANNMDFKCDLGCNSITINCPNIDENVCMIECSDCKYSSIQLNAKVTSLFYINCLQDAGHFDSGTNLDGACYYSEISVSSNVEMIDFVNILCDYEESCQRMTFDFNNDLNAIIGDIQVTCSGKKGCLWSTINANVIGNIEMDCISLNSCKQMTANLALYSSNASVYLDCTNDVIVSGFRSRFKNGACGYSSFKIDGYDLSEYNNDVTVNCLADDCYTTDFWVSNGNLFNLNCNGTRACYEVVAGNKYQDRSSIIYIQCSGNSSCISMNVGCPYDLSQCNMDCNSDYSCSNALIQMWGLDYKYNQLNINCPTNDLTSCNQLTFVCSPYKPSTTLIYDTNDNDFRCDQTSNIYCCPYWNGTSILCDSEDDTNCKPSLSCLTNNNADDCSNTLIDATYFSDYLTIECNDDNECSNSIIYCPDLGCKLICSSYRSCYSTFIYYDGNITDYGNIEIHCLADNSCDNLRVFADYIYNFSFILTGSTMKDTSDYNIYLSLHYCPNININSLSDYNGYMVLYGDYSTNVNISCIGYLACYNGWFYLHYVDNIIITASGSRPLLYSTIYAPYSDNIDVTCTDIDTLSSYEAGYACFADFYLPDTINSSQFNCYGYGCYSIAGLYFLSDASNIKFIVDGMSKCDTILTCILGMYIFCDFSEYSYSTYEVFHSTEAFDYENNCDTYGDVNTCECETMVNNMRWKTDNNNTNTNTPSLTSSTSSITYNSANNNTSYTTTKAETDAGFTLLSLKRFWVIIWIINILY